MKRKTKKIKIKNLYIGGDSEITVQSMTNTKTEDTESTISQIKELTDAGCEIIRVAVPNDDAAKAINVISKSISIPLVADIHFDYKLAIESIENGANAVRINPGNIGGIDKIKEVVTCAREYNVPIRVGVNSGSLEKGLLAKYGGPTPDALVESALNNVKILESLNFDNIVVAVKSSNVITNIESYRLLSSKTDYPLHVGVTEAGTLYSGTVKSCIGIGSLLCDNIGDTIRVSLTDDPLKEVMLGKEILKVCGLRKDGIELVSCPTCGRTKINLIELAEKAEKVLRKVNKPLKVAIMGCVVNGPGEAKEADIGIAGGINEGIIFKKGEIIKKVSEDKLLDELINEINNM